MHRGLYPSGCDCAGEKRGRYHSPRIGDHDRYETDGIYRGNEEEPRNEPRNTDAPASLSFLIWKDVGHQDENGRQ